jgi:hypothetical protein
MHRRLFLILIILLIIGGTIAGLFTNSIHMALTIPMSAMMGINGNGQQSTGVTPSAQAKPRQAIILARDTFQRGNQSLWGRASDGSAWGGDANTLNIFSIKDNTGKIAHGNGAVEAILGPKQDNVDVLVSGTINQFGNEANLGVLLRWTNAQNWYKAYIDGQYLGILKSVNGESSQVITIPFAAQAGQAYSIRFSAIGAMLFVKAWRSDQQEPAQWMIINSDRELTSGQTGVRVFLASDTIIHIKSFITVPANLTPSL